MGAPILAEEPIYAEQFKFCNHRVFVSLDPPKLTQEQHDGFVAGPLSNYAWAMNWLNGGPTITGNAVKLRSYGVPLFEWFSTREAYGWFPYSRVFPFACEFKFTFPQADPVYSVPIIVPGLENLLGDLDDPLLIYQQGSATTRATGMTDPGDDGNIRIISQGSDVYNAANDQAEHTIRFEWDPLHIVNANHWVLKLDNVTIYSTNSARAANTKCHFGWSWDPLFDLATGEYIEAPGTGASPVVVLEVSDFKTTQLGSNGYESYDDPAWTFPNAGATNHDNAAEGEIHTQDNVRWAMIPRQLVGDINGSRGRNVQIPSVTVDLNVIEGDPYDLYSFPWVGRSVLVDSRQENYQGQTSWRRQIAAYVKKSDPTEEAEQKVVRLSANSMIEEKLNFPIMRTWSGQVDDNVIINTNYKIHDIWNDCLDTAEAIHGAVPIESARLIRDMDVVAGDQGTGGSALIDVYARLVDQCAYEYYSDYPAISATDPERHGRMRTHAWNLGDGTPDYELPLGQVTSFEVHESADNGPSQVSYRQNDPNAAEDTLVSTWALPTVGMHPTVPFPITNRVLSDSIAFVYSLQETGLQSLKDKNNVNVTGGIPMHRFRLQAAQRRIADVVVVGRDHIEPSDEFSCLATVCLEDETWVVDQIDWSIKDDVFESRLKVHTHDYVSAIKRAL